MGRGWVGEGGLPLVDRTATGKSLELLLLILQRLCQHAPKSPIGPRYWYKSIPLQLGHKTPGHSLTAGQSFFRKTASITYASTSSSSLRVARSTTMFQESPSFTGYLLHDSILRPSQIFISPSADKSQAEDTTKKTCHTYHVFDRAKKGDRNATVHVGTATMSSDTSRDCLPNENLTKISK
jgi:hypothetical protein